ncbi:acyltransferase [Legionella worsleiensis]|uniref:Maltose O-acetyltransferase n=1 Tax=Legionella worsleiensis TaxID=45076 RepID=A0A0W1AJZ6_9GAMM|nr:DapH/DapD/GlmU-related protein [Legionella worsleiensis]KTD81649.1 Maltose O-acetyltransferase [Legionella worsleiensis]STY31941.1 Galactoside O-acetyltransferase [Legionella worsleiensis]
MTDHRKLKILHYLFFDLLSAFFAVGPAVLTWSVIIFLVFYFSGSTTLLIIVLLLSPLLSGLTFISFLALFKFFIPKLKPGVTHIGFNKNTLSWYCHLALNRSIKVSGLRYLLNISYLLKFLLYRALGAKIGFGINTPMEFTFVDLPLLTIGSGTTFGENVHVSCHYFTGDRLLLKPVTIGTNCFLGANCIIGPGSKIGDKAYVGYGNIVSGDVIADNEYIGDLEWRNGSPTRVMKIQKNNLTRPKKIQKH